MNEDDFCSSGERSRFILALEFYDLLLLLNEGLKYWIYDLGDYYSVLSRIGDNMNLFIGEIVDNVDSLFRVLKC